MNFTLHRTTRTALLAASFLTIAACTTLIDTPPADPQKLIDERAAVMKGFVGALGAGTQYTQDKVTAAAAQAKVAAARGKVAAVPSMVPRGTALGDRGVTRSRALSTIFANRADFEAKFDALGANFASLDAALAKNAKADAATALAATKKTCLACHDKYRAPED
jgi:cytochrome c556